MTVVPDLDEAAWAAALASVESPRGIALRDLDEHLASHPDALTSGDPRCPLALVQFARALNAAGRPAVVPPGCSPVRARHRGTALQRPGGQVMPTLLHQHEQEAVHPVRADREDRRPARRGRYLPVLLQDRSPGRRGMRGPAAAPGGPPSGSQTARPCARVAGGRPSAPARPAAPSGQPRSVADGAYCNTCYRRLRQPRRACGRCGLVRPIAAKAAADSPGLCYNCNGLLPPAPCVICGKTSPATSTPFTASSAGPADRITRNPAPAAASSGASMPAGPGVRSVPACYVQILDHPGPCPQCGTARPLIARAADGTLACGRCAGIPDAYSCLACGSSGRLYADGLCPRCLLPRVSAATWPALAARSPGSSRRRPGSRRGQEPARGAAVAEAEPERAPARRPRGQRRDPVPRPS